jgi:hypothetical protein
VFFWIATAAAPMTAMLFNVPVIAHGLSAAPFNPLKLFRFRTHDTARYAAVGRFVHEEA